MHLKLDTLQSEDPTSEFPRFGNLSDWGRGHNMTANDRPTFTGLLIEELDPFADCYTAETPLNPADFSPEERKHFQTGFDAFKSYAESVHHDETPIDASDLIIDESEEPTEIDLLIDRPVPYWPVASLAEIRLLRMTELAQAVLRASPICGGEFATALFRLGTYVGGDAVERLQITTDPSGNPILRRKA